MADRPDTGPVGGRGESMLSARYEQLRQVALDGHAEGWRHGLGVLATKGMAGWMKACQSVTPSPAPAATPARDIVTRLGPATRELVSVMAAMALAHT